MALIYVFNYNRFDCVNISSIGCISRSKHEECVVPVMAIYDDGLRCLNIPNVEIECVSSVFDYIVTCKKETS